ncbi:hypothetical protein [Phyllobacterium zundukense]|uniref:Uncharacterized protein n=1 Tax=Phyllobacterium zundukense TaxID=1867719 RepID=A0A2N9VUV9_9HYPH|nr:hypothetical protein [Phyllobacterium zundukense]ATU95606.1 hypothetical protein BLM14_28170 [Phyllobacterium zundukense]PIO43277.1 hypothetical protein B5P45_18770 [Phyllobacterium zundukense]
MNIVDRNAKQRPDNLLRNNFGIPVIAIVGLPLLALFVALFLGFGLVLQSQRTDLTRTYSERTAEFLARDLANQLGKLLTPAAQYVDNLAATIKRAECKTADCIFAIIQMQRANPGAVPSQIFYIRFGGRSGHVFSIFKVAENDQGFSGTVKTSEPDPNQLVVLEPGKLPRAKPYNLFTRGWYQGGMIDAVK